MRIGGSKEDVPAKRCCGLSVRRTRAGPPLTHGSLKCYEAPVVRSYLSKPYLTVGLLHVGTLAHHMGYPQGLRIVAHIHPRCSSRHGIFDSKLETIRRAVMVSLVHKLERYRPYGWTSMRGFISVGSIRSTGSYRALERWTYLFSGSPLERS